MNLHSGILGPGTLESTRRVRTLGLAASTRLFNELAVQGLGVTPRKRLVTRGLRPNHHVLFDNGGSAISEQYVVDSLGTQLSVCQGHRIGGEYLTYHRLLWRCEGK
jgi:hypothetical protein